MSQELIVKVQWPLQHYDPDGGPPCCMIYDEDRSFMELVPCTQGLFEAMGGTGKKHERPPFIKRFFKAHLNEEQTLVIDDPVSDPGWCETVMDTVKSVKLKGRNDHDYRRKAAAVTGRKKDVPRGYRKEDWAPKMLPVP